MQQFDRDAVSMVIEAPPADLYTLVADVTRMPEPGGPPNVRSRTFRDGSRRRVPTVGACRTRRSPDPPGTSLAGDERPEGLLARIVGETDAGRHVVEVWQTQTHHDRFVAELLYPAFERIEHRFDDRPVAFHVTDLYLADPITEETS